MTIKEKYEKKYTPKEQDYLKNLLTTLKTKLNPDTPLVPAIKKKILNFWEFPYLYQEIGKFMRKQLEIEKEILKKNIEKVEGLYELNEELITQDPTNYHDITNCLQEAKSIFQRKNHKILIQSQHDYIITKNELPQKTEINFDFNYLTGLELNEKKYTKYPEKYLQDFFEKHPQKNNIKSIDLANPYENHDNKKLLLRINYKNQKTELFEMEFAAKNELTKPFECNIVAL